MADDIRLRPEHPLSSSLHEVEDCWELLDPTPPPVRLIPGNCGRCGAPGLGLCDDCLIAAKTLPGDPQEALRESWFAQDFEHIEACHICDDPAPVGESICAPCLCALRDVAEEARRGPR